MDAFISHTSKDNPTAKRLESELEAAGLEVWTDLSDMPRGSLVDAELLRNLRACDVLLLLWSKAAKTSNYVAAEFFTLKAIEYGRKAGVNVSSYEHDLRLIQRDLAANV